MRIISAFPIAITKRKARLKTLRMQCYHRMGKKFCCKPVYTEIGGDGWNCIDHQGKEP